MYLSVMESKKLKLIVSIDGGGIRGVLPLMILRHIEQLFKENSLSDFIPKIDLISGTSTGSIISAGLLVKAQENYLYSITDLLNLYCSKGSQLFNLANASEGKSNGLKILLMRKFHNVKLSHLKKKFIFVSYDKRQGKLFLFRENMAKASTIPLGLALAACSAVPSIFKPIEWGNHELIDGGFIVKNPSKIAYQRAQEVYPDDPCLLLSFGTGEMKGASYDEVEKDAQKVDDFLRIESGTNANLDYFRFQPKLNVADDKLDNVSPENIQHLIEDGRAFIDASKALFEHVIEVYKENKSMLHK